MKNVDLGLLIFRLNLGVLMLMHGIAKVISGPSGLVGLMQAKGLPGFIAYGVYLGEVLAPLLIIFGFRTRLGGALMAFTMVTAIATAHAGDIFTIGKGGGWGIELQALYLFGSLALIFTGSGKYALSRNKFLD